MESRQSLSWEREYMREMLYRVEQKVRERFDVQARQVVGNAFARTLPCRTADEIVELLYRLDGFRQFALRLMWLLRLLRMEGRKPTDVVLEDELERLVLCLVPLMQEAAGGSSRRAAGR